MLALLIERRLPMSILIDIQLDDWLTEEQLKEFLVTLLPDVPIYCRDPGNHCNEIRMLATSSLQSGILKKLPNLQLIQKLGAGVDSIVNDPDLNNSVRVCRLRPDIPAHEIAEYCLAYVLSEQRQHRHFHQNQLESVWLPTAPLKSGETTVSVLGLGHIGSRAAHYFSTLGFNVIGWSRSQKKLTNVDCRSGMDALPEILAKSDYVVAILPSTKETRNLINSKTLVMMRSNAVLINAGRGDLVNEEHLLNAIDQSVLRGAYLDVFQQEPLPVDHPFWTHPKITITPHVSGWHLDGGMDVIAENYRALETHSPLLNEVDIKRGY